MNLQMCLPIEIRPISIMQGRDADVLDVLIPLHVSCTNPRILDATYGLGTIWQGCSYCPDATMDIRPLDGVDLIDDFTVMASVADASFDVIVFDPPHLPTAAASENGSKMWEHRYGITADDKNRAGDNVIPLFVPFLRQAKRVLVGNGIVLAKIADLVHNHRYQWQQVAFVNACREMGLTPCDMLIKHDYNGGNLKSSKWQETYHVRKAHCFWIVARNSDRCERSG